MLDPVEGLENCDLSSDDEVSSLSSMDSTDDPRGRVDEVGAEAETLGPRPPRTTIEAMQARVNAGRSISPSELMGVG
jgi:hypothetical protein